MKFDPLFGMTVVMLNRFFPQDVRTVYFMRNVRGILRIDEEITIIVPVVGRVRLHIRIDAVGQTAILREVFVDRHDGKGVFADLKRLPYRIGVAEDSPGRLFGNQRFAFFIEYLLCVSGQDFGGKDLEESGRGFHQQRWIFFFCGCRRKGYIHLLSLLQQSVRFYFRDLCFHLFSQILIDGPIRVSVGMMITVEAVYLIRLFEVFVITEIIFHLNRNDQKGGECHREAQDDK